MMVTWNGTIRVAMITKKTTLRPRNCRRASANAVIESNQSSRSVVPPAKTNVLTTSRPNGSSVRIALIPAQLQ